MRQFNSVHAWMNSLALSVSQVSEAVARVFGDHCFCLFICLCSITLYPARVVIRKQRERSCDHVLTRFQCWAEWAAFRFSTSRSPNDGYPAH